MIPLMASPSATKVCFSSLLFINLTVIYVSAYRFRVGGDRGWIKPTRNDTETYDEWATSNRFHVGDSIYFKYKKDSVLVVNYTNYMNCVLSDPNSKFKDGDTEYHFDRYGFFYFISGEPGHCKSGQKLVIRVMVQSGIEPPPRSAPPPGKSDGGSGDGDESSFEWGPPSLNSTIKLSVASYFMTALGGMMVILYLFI
ncbi:hypothetical protein HHK36_023991 [Tetracentron sinense]|uniref:Phytocyanin domain-containing protein n=1 Tax=Tetracentron sinense TaxID=13715 RepID=A0A835D8E8_TETSI|nr:hypothetical protein HHK36_023991 [Tetracentron sinense]